MPVHVFYYLYLPDAGGQVLRALEEEWDDERHGTDGRHEVTLVDEDSEQRHAFPTHVGDAVGIQKYSKISLWRKILNKCVPS